MWPFNKTHRIHIAEDVLPDVSDERLLYWGRMTALINSAGPIHRSWAYRCHIHGDRTVFWGPGGVGDLTDRCNYISNNDYGSGVRTGCREIRVIVGPTNTREEPGHSAHPSTFCKEDCRACYPPEEAQKSDGQ